jgi:hypothetical protein
MKNISIDQIYNFLALSFFIKAVKMLNNNKKFQQHINRAMTFVALEKSYISCMV